MKHPTQKGGDAPMPETKKKKPKAKPPEPQLDSRGRPSTYTQEIAALICEHLQDGLTLKEICRAEHMPHESTVRKWACEDREGFYTLYAKAREIGYQAMADELLVISDNAHNDWMERNYERDQDNGGWVANGEHLQRSRLRVDTRKWLLSKALPKLYGDKTTTTIEPSDGLTGLLEAIAGRPRLG